MDFVNRLFENSSILFKKEYLTEYTNHPPVNAALNGVTLLNYDDFFNWYNNIGRSTGSRGIDLENNQIKKRDDFLEMAGLICGNITSDYGIGTLYNLVEQPEKLDLLVAVAPDYLETNITDSSSDNRYEAIRKKILGFIVIEKGECIRLPEVYCLKLICTKEGNINGLKIKGSILVGAFLYCLKSDPSKSQIALLELAGRYRNLPGFFAYSKFGFGKDLTLHDPYCFYGVNNLPMSVNLDEIYTNKQAIIEVLTGTNPLSDEILHKKDMTKLVFTGIPKNEQQFSEQYKIVKYADLLLDKEYDYIYNITLLMSQKENPARADLKPVKEKQVEALRVEWRKYREESRITFNNQYLLYRSYDDYDDDDDFDEFDGNYDISPESTSTRSEMMDSEQLPLGWTAYIDSKTNMSYYHNSTTGESSWIKPDSDNSGRPPPPPPPPPQDYIDDRPIIKFSDHNIGGVKKRTRKNKVTKRANKKKGTYLIKLQNRKTKRNKLI